MPTSNKKSLSNILGSKAAVITIAIVTLFEGVMMTGYLDPVGIPTKCMGDTNNVQVGAQYSTQECLESLETQLVAHAEPVLACVPQLKGRTFELAASVSFAYNIGTTAFCNSTTAKRFRAGDRQGACKAMNENDQGKPQWVTSRGRVLPGLVERRAAERALCEQGLAIH